MSFIDTNVLIHATDTLSIERDRARAALERAADSGVLLISRQILREFVAVLSRPQASRAPFSLNDAFAAAERLIEYVEIIEDGPNVWVELAALSKNVVFGGKQVHDANIVATMLASGETRLLTFNISDFRRFEPLIELIEP